MTSDHSSPAADTTHEPAGSRAKLLESARAEVKKRGVLGLRVADVAANANYSVSVIYRHFGDRDGLLAAVLGDLYEEILAESSTRFLTVIPAEGEITIDHLVRMVPAPSERDLVQERKDRLQILAVAATNPALEARISEIAQQARKNLEWYLDSLRPRMVEHADFDARVFTIMVVNQLLYYNSLLGDFAVDDETYYGFLRDKLIRR